MFRKNPKLDVNLSDSDRKVLRVGWFLIIIHFCITLYFYFELPEKIPIHFNLKGEVDGYGSKSSWWFLFILNFLIYYGISALITRMKPWKFNYPIKVTEGNVEEVYRLNLRMLAVLNSTIAFFIALISIEIVLKVKMISSIQLGFAFIPLCSLIALIPFFYMYKMFKVPK